MPRWTVPLISAAVAAVLVAGVAGVATVGGEDSPGPAAPRSSTSPSSSSPATAAPSTTTRAAGAADVEAVVPVLQAFVEKERGLAFKQPVDVTLLGNEAFEARVNESDEEDDDEVRDAEAVLQAMGLLDPDVDLLDAVRRLSAASVLGFYDTETKELVVRGAAAGPFVRTVLVHELTHALEDQHFDLNRIDDLGDEAVLGFQALAEGSALRIEDRYRASLSRAERRAAQRERGALASDVPDDVPRVLQVLLGFPYSYGPDLVAAVVRAGGQARLDAAFEKPPASSEHVLDPRRYLDGDEPRAVPAPAADRPAFDDGEIGQLFLTLMLQAELDDGDAREAADGWGGDRYVAWRDGDRTCVRMDFVMDTPGDTAHLSAALAEWAGERPGTASSAGTSLRTCG